MDLYALPPEDFTAARDAAAKQDKVLKALRKPTVAAWVVNTLVRRQAPLLDDLLALGAELGRAQSDRDPTALRQLTEQRRQLVAAVTQTAVDLAGRDVTAAVRAEVEATLDAALADPASADAVRTGQLVRALSYAGFGGAVDLDGAVASHPRAKAAPVAPPVDKSSGKAAEKRAAKVAALETEALEAAGALDDAVQRAEAAARAVDAGEKALTQASSEEAAAAAAVEDAKRALHAAEEAAKSAHRDRLAATTSRDEAARKARVATTAVSEAQEASDAARRALDAARRA